MPTSPRCPRERAGWPWALVLLVFALGAEAATPKRVLLLHSFGRDFAPYDTIAAVFRNELARNFGAPLVISEATLDAARSLTGNEQEAFFEYLRARFESAPPDVVVTMGPPAARFYLAHRDQLFPATPLVLAALDVRLAKSTPLRPGDAATMGKVDLPGLVSNILTLLPETRTVAVVIGATDLEKFWLNELRRETASLTGRIDFIWFNELSLEQMLKRAATLPPDSAILYGLLVTDAAGVPHERQDALLRLRAVANAPIFGIYESELGIGVVGGPYTSQRLSGEHMAAATARILKGAAGEPQVSIAGVESPVYDWRELKRWKIDPSRLPPGSEIRFKPPSLWKEHGPAMMAITAALLLQATLITALLVQRTRRQRAEREAEGLAGRLVTAHEDERRRLARELHDDVTQRLAGLAIEAAELEGRTKSSAMGDAAHSIRDGLVELGNDVHALSYRLHPSVIEDLGLVEALRIECDRVAGQRLLQVSFDCRDVPRKVPADTALCLFRVGQEALRNVERHARAKSIEVSVTGRDQGLALCVRDDGEGFDATGERGRASLGLASMRERVRMLGGRLDIESGPGAGTTLTAWVPLTESA